MSVHDIRPGFEQLPLSMRVQHVYMTIALRPGSGDKLADIHQFAEDLKASDDPHDVLVGVNLTLVLKGKNR